MAVTTRRAILADADALRRLNAADLGYDHPLEAVESALRQVLASERDALFVAEVDGAVVGYVHAEEYRLIYLPLLVNVLGLAVASDRRRLGAGRALMDAVEAWARQRGASGVRLVSGTTRGDAHRFYAELGFEPVKTQVNLRKPLVPGGGDGHADARAGD